MTTDVSGPAQRRPGKGGGRMTTEDDETTALAPVSVTRLPNRGPPRSRPRQPFDQKRRPPTDAPAAAARIGAHTHTKGVGPSSSSFRGATFAFAMAAAVMAAASFSLVPFTAFVVVAYAPSPWTTRPTRHFSFHRDGCCGGGVRGSTLSSPGSKSLGPPAGRCRFLRSLAAAPAAPKPIDGAYWPERFPAKEHCSRCGLCETTFVSKVNESCAFLNDGMARMDRLEVKVHGRRRHASDMAWSASSPPSEGNNAGSKNNRVGEGADEGRFGVLERPMLLARGVGVPGAQWTGCVTGIASSMLEADVVDAVVCIASKETSSTAEGGGGAGWSEPEPILARTVEEVMRGRGVKPALAPSLRVLDEIMADDSIKRLLFCGVGCAVQAFRAIQDDLNLDEIYVLGTNCADNSPTPEAARNFLRDGVGVDVDRVRGYEFMQDFKVHVKLSPPKGEEDDDNGGQDDVPRSTGDDVTYVKMPYFCLPGNIADAAIADSCLACFDYTNGLADVVVGYMAAPLDGTTMDRAPQSLTVRNPRGATMVQTAVDAGRLEVGGEVEGRGAHEKFALATVQSDSIVMAMTGGDVKEKGMPRPVGEVMSVIMRGIGPKGTNFARYSIDYHVLRNYLHVLDEWGEERVQRALPEYALDIVGQYLSEDESFKALRDKILAKNSRTKT